jgi:hypothetical protein
MTAIDSCSEPTTSLYRASRSDRDFENLPRYSEPHSEVRDCLSSEIGIVACDLLENRAKRAMISRRPQ